jgi:transposase InsO family protein
VFVSPSTLLRVALKHRVVLPGEPFRPRPVLPAMPQVPWEKNRIWIWDATHFTRSKRVAYAIVDVVTRYWIGYLLTSEQTSTQAQLLFARALEDQDLLDADGLPPVIEDGLPILVAWSDNGSEMTATDTRQFMALMAITQHHGRPGTPTDQAHIESFFSHLKGDWPHLTGLTDPAARWPDDRDPRGILPSRAREQNGGMAETLDEPDREHRSDPEPGPVTFPSRPTYINRSYWLGIPRSRITPTTQTNWSFVSWPSVVLFVLACWLLPDHGFWPDVLFWMAAALMVWRGWRRVRASAGGNTAAVESELPASQAQHSDRR